VRLAFVRRERLGRLLARLDGASIGVVPIANSLQLGEMPIAPRREVGDGQIGEFAFTRDARRRTSALPPSAALRPRARARDLADAGPTAWGGRLRALARPGAPWGFPGAPTGCLQAGYATGFLMGLRWPAAKAAHPLRGDRRRAFA
jgi:hypothetical protein